MRVQLAHRIIEWLSLILLLALAAYVRLLGGAQNPGWYPDEGAHLSIALNVLRGQTQFLAVNQSVLLFSRLPLFEWLLAGALALAGAGPGGDPSRGMAVLRALTGWLGVLNTLGVYLVARPLAGGDGPRRWLPLLAAGVFVAYPAALTAGRFGFGYHLLAALLLAVVAAAQRYLATGRTAYLALVAGLAGLGTLVEVWGWVLPPLLVVLVAARFGWGKRWRAAGAHLALAVGLAALPPALYAAQQLLTVPAAFLFDLRFVFARVSGSALRQVYLLGDNAVTLFGQDGWLALGAVGWLLLRPPGLRTAALILAGGALLLIGRTTPLYSLSFYYLIPLLPLVPLGIASLVSAVPGRWRAWLAYGAMAGLAVWTLGLQVFQIEKAGLPTPVDQVLISGYDAQAAAAYLADVRTPEALVLASPAAAWLLPGEVADVQMALAYAGQATPHVPADLPRERYVYSPAFERAQFVVVDNLWRNWAVFDVAAAAALLAEVEQWPVAFRAGEVVVYQRPGR